MHKNIVIFILILIIPLIIFGQTTTEIAKTGIQSTVSVIALDNISQPLGFGSGFILDNELIVTNVHVIEGSNSAYVLLEGQTKKYPVNGYVAIDRTNDLVILKVPGLFGTKLNLASDNLPEIGEKIYAVGNPKGLSGTFSEGLISGIRDFTSNQVLQITAPISPGSSGGPVLNSSGKVVGIAFASFSQGQNINFAIPVKYLSVLKTKITTPIALGAVKSQSKANSSSTANPNIKEGVVVRNIEYDSFFDGTSISFSLKNNLPYKVSHITVLFLLYDATGTVVDYFQDTYLSPINHYSDGVCIEPFLAKQIIFRHGSNRSKFNAEFKSGYKIKYRVLDFKIKDE